MERPHRWGLVYEMAELADALASGAADIQADRTITGSPMIALPPRGGVLRSQLNSPDLAGFQRHPRGSASRTAWGIGGTDPATYLKAEEAGRVAQDIPVTHSAKFAPVIQPTLDTGIQALVVAALAWLGAPAATQQ